ncbi:type II toxin-antitoxin system Phd/YefM family antitoxin [Methylobacterium sp. J-043]|uniref:type II toxin-antitoxin system Phd/YefM family antitoxin n=1 Tax=Methylobacteriaceae TaxID=119045 RepID=UPI00074FA435|nr:MULTISPECIES: type II toxin-antitoxin system Phd/YefM family antitoxin [Methylobacteriaceae]MCJ2029470.1 type II toxin-antitoxin system Phd/YefM family antitoxin [Methylobacterium sp. J-043]AMB44351.1 prevent-host-death protein [Methylobacterium sp. AMS5]MCP1551431.1 prevent-host-death family protein [Methylorubrum zatmanii]MCP1556368.1 prevent-host-death family protein [Methylorubrum extorquens]MCP1581758.1 prevent-host-death family protein [Methylorubrum extorquens]
MASFTLTDLGNKSGEVVEAAFRGPVDITKRGKRKFVLMTAEQFDRLTGTGSQRAYRAEDLTAPERDEILAGLDAVAQDEGRDD